MRSRNISAVKASNTDASLRVLVSIVLETNRKSTTPKSFIEMGFHQLKLREKNNMVYSLSAPRCSTAARILRSLCQDICMCMCVGIMCGSVC